MGGVVGECKVCRGEDDGGIGSVFRLVISIGRLLPLIGVAEMWRLIRAACFLGICFLRDGQRNIVRETFAIQSQLRSTPGQHRHHRKCMPEREELGSIYGRFEAIREFKLLPAPTVLPFACAPTCTKAPCEQRDDDVNCFLGSFSYEAKSNLSCV